MSNRKFSDEFKEQAVDRLIRLGKSVNAVARELGINEGSLRLWKKKAQEEGWGPSPDVEQELRKLRRDSSRVVPRGCPVLLMRHWKEKLSTAACKVKRSVQHNSLFSPTSRRLSVVNDRFRNQA